MGSNERAVLVALLASTGPDETGRALCTVLIERASDILVEAPAAVLEVIGGKSGAEDRLAGVALLSELCGHCRMCPRGQALAEDETGERRSRGLGPIGAARWR